MASLACSGFPPAGSTRAGLLEVTLGDGGGGIKAGGGGGGANAGGPGGGKNIVSFSTALFSSTFLHLSSSDAASDVV